MLLITKFKLLHVELVYLFFSRTAGVPLIAAAAAGGDRKSDAPVVPLMHLSLSVR